MKPTLYLASSALQGQPLDETLGTLWALLTRAIEEGWVSEFSGIQLCPGNIVDNGIGARAKAWLDALKVPYRYHQTFSWEHKVGPHLWGEATADLPDEPTLTAKAPGAGPWSVHPPNRPSFVRSIQDSTKEAHRWMDAYAKSGLIIETMWGPYDLADGYRLETLMERGIPLAVDVSHIYIGLQRDRVASDTAARLLTYEGLAEMHVSANDGRADIHRPLRPGDYGIAEANTWSKDTGGVAVFESYFHRLTDEERLDQIRLAAGA